MEFSSVTILLLFYFFVGQMLIEVMDFNYSFSDDDQTLNMRLNESNVCLFIYLFVYLSVFLFPLSFIKCI